MDAELRSVSKVFDRHRALWRASVHFPSGSTSALLGANGAGKSTLLWLLSTLWRPTEGEIRIGDVAGSRLRQARDRVGFVAHASMTYGELTGRENLQLFARLCGRTQPAEDARRWLAALALDDAADRAAKTYSRGMRQRLSLGRALIADAPLLLLDEPFSGLDVASVAQLADLLEARKGAGTTIFVTHDLNQAARLADRYVMLQAGRVVRIEEGPRSAEQVRTWFAGGPAPEAPA